MQTGGRGGDEAPDRKLGQASLHDFTARLGDVGEPLRHALGRVGQLFVIEAHQMKYRGVKVSPYEKPGFTPPAFSVPPWFSCMGVRPNSPPQTTSVSSSSHVT